MGFDIEGLVKAAGYIGLFIIIFAETGLLVGFLLPGDTLLITTGLMIQQNRVDLNIWWLIPLLIVAAVVGDAVGYQIGKHSGPRIFRKEDGRFFRKDHLLRAKAFYERHGGKTIVIARFLAFIRTFAPTVAGAAEMPYRKFAVYNITGGVAWITSLLLAGYYFGKAIPAELVDVFFIGVLGMAFVLSVGPAAFHLIRERRRAGAGRQA